MNRKILLSLLAVPTVVGSMLTSLVMATMADAAEPSTTAVTEQSCDAPIPSNLKSSGFKQSRGTLIASASGIAGDDFATDFSAAESDAAVQLFGCDCPACIRSLRQLHSQSLSQTVLKNKSQGHCLANLQRRTSPQQVKDVLRTLDTDKASNAKAQ
jgi:hypothetical protein